MTSKQYDLVIIGGGPAGLAAALSAHCHKVKTILVIERDKELGGILNQCIHNGFGLHHFKEELTGPEYSTRVIKEIIQTKIEFLVDTMVLKFDSDKVVHAINSKDGYLKIAAKAIVLAMGCRERTRGAIRIYGARPAGVYTAGTAQRLVNIDGYLPGKNVVILGSGDIGLIMARRMTLEGAKVAAVLEILPHSNGLTRNVVQCLEDYNIPLLLSHTISRIHGKDQVTGVTITKVDDQLKPISDTEKFIECDTVLLSVGLIPENEISRLAEIELDAITGGPIVDEFRQTSKAGVFACGNVLKVFDLVDAVSADGALAGLGAAKYINGDYANTKKQQTVAEDSISNKAISTKLPNELTCICCPVGCTLHIEKTADGFVITGNKCPRGKTYALEELTAPKRTVTSTVKITGGLYPVISVKTDKAVPKDKIFWVMDILSDIEVKAPINVGDVIIENIADTGANIVATKDMPAI